MNPLIGIEEGFKEIWAHKFRSFLTMLGIVLGVAALITMSSLVEGQARGQFRALQANGGIERIEIDDAPVPEEQEAISELSPGRTYRDALAIRKSATLVSAVGPQQQKWMKVSYQGQVLHRPVHAITRDWKDINQYEVEAGRFITDLDEKLANRVIVIGAYTVGHFFGGDPERALGKRLKINGEVFTVVGCMPLFLTETEERRRKLGITQKRAERRRERTGGRRGERHRLWRKNIVTFIPITTMMATFHSTQIEGDINLGPKRTLDNLHVRIRDVNQFDQTLQQLRNILLRTHRGIRDFGFDTREDWFESIKTTTSQLRLTGTLIAGISLLVGGLGITNIMLASITERIREIGIRRAIGARRSDIFVQIVIESVVLALIGAAIGLALGLLMAYQIFPWLAPESYPPVVLMQTVGLSVGFAAAVGIIAGLYPAYKASQLSPIQALRYE